MISIMVPSQPLSSIQPLYLDDSSSASGRFDVCNYDSNELQQVLASNIHFDYGYNAILVDKWLRVISTDLLQFNIEDINRMQNASTCATNILSLDNGSAVFFENAKTWFSHVLDQSNPMNDDLDQDLDGDEKRYMVMDF